MASIVPADAPTRRSPHSEATRAPAIVVLTLPRTWFTLVWVEVVIVRATCIAFLFSMGWICRVMVSSPYIEYFANFLSPYYASLFRPSAWVYFAFSAAHGYQLLRTMLASVEARALLFGNHHVLMALTDGYNCSPQPSRLQRVRSCYQDNAFFRFFFDRQGVFSAESPYFQKLFLVQELIEMSSQTAQMLSASSLIGRPWSSHLYVSVFVINSCSTPMIEHSFAHRSPALERVLCLALDMLPDSIMSIVPPALIVGRYLLMFDTATQSFPPTVFYSAVGFNRLVMENKQVLVYNWLDLVVKLIPHLSIYSCLNATQSLIRPDSTPLTLTKVQDEIAAAAHDSVQKHKRQTAAAASKGHLHPATTQVNGWVEDVTRRHDAKVFVHSTPFCASKSSEEIDRSFGADTALTCVESNPRSAGRYPFDLVIALRNDGGNG